MKDKEKKLTGALKVQLTPSELAQLKQRYRQSTCRSLSEYARQLITGGKVVLYYRNQSFDDFMEEGIKLRKELQGIPERGNWSKENEIRLLNLMQEIKSIINKLVDLCMPK